jgi:AcrR family transcriptional regulator
MALKNRARTTSDKQKRRDVILNNAWELFKNSNGFMPNVSDIAAKSGFSKGTIYNYFETKEEIFMHLTIFKLKDWFDNVDLELKKYKALTSGQMAVIITGYLIENPLILKMISIIKAVLEENCVEKTIFETRMMISEFLNIGGEKIAEKLTDFNKEKAQETLLRIFAVISGLWQVLTFPPNVKNMLAESGAGVFNRDFVAVLNETVSILLTCGCKDS